MATLGAVKVSLSQAKNTLTQLLQQVERGERVTICRHGVAIADLVSTTAGDRKPRLFGTLSEKITNSDPDWAKPQKDVEAWLRGDV